jgi:hypothetical protein
MTEQTQKIWEAFCGELIQEPTDDMKEALATAIRAAADQVVPENANAVGDEHDDARHDQWMRIRYKILAIAAELEAL